MHQKTVLSHADAMTIIDAIRARAEQNADGLAAAVADEHGELLAFLRTDGCPLPPITISQNKAYTAARERTESRKLGQRSRDEGFPMTNFGELRYITWGGGVPVVHDGVVIGAVGVSGLTEERDIEYAKHGIAALLDA
jgi:glc operon protein GlcG